MSYLNLCVYTIDKTQGKKYGYREANSAPRAARLASSGIRGCRERKVSPPSRLAHPKDSRIKEERRHPLISFLNLSAAWETSSFITTCYWISCSAKVFSGLSAPRLDVFAAPTAVVEWPPATTIGCAQGQ